MVGSKHKPFEQRLLGMQAVAGLFKDDAARAIENVAGDLLAPMGWQTVHYAHLRRRLGQELGVDLEAGKFGAAQLALGLLPHARPYIGINDVGLADRVRRYTVLDQFALAANAAEGLLESGIEAIPFWASERATLLPSPTNTSVLPRMLSSKCS